MKSWTGGKDKDYALFTFPLNESVDGPFRFSFGWSASGTAPANWTLSYSNDNVVWYTPAPTDEPHFVIPQGKELLLLDDRHHAADSAGTPRNPLHPRDAVQPGHGE